MSTDTAVRTVDGTDVPAPGTWVIDHAHSTVEAVARHLMVSKVRGSFELFSGSIHVAERLEDSSVEVEIEAASINTRQPDRDGHLRSPDFLDAENHPKLTFESTGIEQAGDVWKVHGDLTIRGVSNPITLDVEYLGVLPNPFGSTTAAFSARAQLERDKWGMNWNQALEAGGVLVGKTLTIEIEIQAVNQG